MFDDIAALERHVAANPASPLFARLASLYIDGNRPAQALKLCLQGNRLHPDYPTGLLMTARAQIMLRQYSDARQTLQELLRLLPSCRAAQKLGERMTELELEYPPYAGTATVLISMQEVAREAGADRRLQWSHQDDILPGIEHFAARTEADEPPEESGPRITEKVPPLFDLGDLARRLEGARIPALPEEREEESQADEAPPTEEINLGSRPVTETLAAIYEQQGRLQEAMEGYQRLAILQPGHRQQFEAKVQELRLRLLQQQQQ
ncbi:MAG: hypothetical protein KFF77_03080 [Bacteroidetes bacterium]|nr:hypothetical protein [Bacteroidota bacterium]